MDIATQYWTESDDKNTHTQPNGFPGNMPAYIDQSGRMMMGAIKRSWRRSNPYYETAGVGDDYVVVPEFSGSNLNLYEIISLRMDRSNTTTAPTLNFGNTGSLTIVKMTDAGKTALAVGDLIVGAAYSFYYDGTNYILGNPSTVDASTVDGVTPGAAGLEILEAETTADVRSFLDTAPYVPTRGALKALDTTKDTVAILKENGREGVFDWTVGDFSALIAIDTAEGVYIKADAIAATAGAWVRDFDGDVDVNWFGGKPDCTAEGVGTDVIPAISAAIALALAVYGNGCRVVLPGGRYRGATAAIIDLGGKCQVQLDFIGTITPDNVAMTMLTFRNGLDLKLNANLFEGGVFTGWGPPLPYVANYFTTQEVVAAGGQEAFKIQGVFGCALNLRAYGYAGRVLRTTEKADVGHPQTGAMSGHIETGRNLDLSKARVAQSLWADAGTQVGTGNWGSLDRLVLDFDAYQPVWVNLNDIEIATIDSAIGDGGPTFLGCQVVEGNFWYVGDVDGNPTNKHIVFGKSADRSCSDVSVTKMRFLNAGNGLYCDNLTRGNFDHVVMGGSIAFTRALELKDCVDVKVGITGVGGAMLADIHGALTENVTISPTGYSISDNHVYIQSSVVNPVFIIDAYLEDAAVGKTLIKVDTTAPVFIVNPYLASNNGFLMDISSASNSVGMIGGGMFGSATAFEGGIEAVSMSGVAGRENRASSNVRANNGGNAANEGGAYRFGIGTAGFATYSVMGQLKGKLTNSVGTELQGGMSMQYRPTGAAGQALLDGFEVSHTTTDNETVGILLTRISGSMVAKRIKVGAAGTGPGGTGRAMYVDN